ncbi:hypothetical protein C8R46DRAFT_1236648 [Mycena filopes]|nr:hypothetical protein C8R46DRAFT_1236648 [Mycena filopes]
MRGAAVSLELTARRRRGAGQTITPYIDVRRAGFQHLGRRQANTGFDAHRYGSCGDHRSESRLKKKTRREANTRLYCSTPLPRLARDNFFCPAGLSRREPQTLFRRQGSRHKTRREANPRLCFSTMLYRASRTKRAKIFLPAAQIPHFFLQIFNKNPSTALCHLNTLAKCNLTVVPDSNPIADASNTASDASNMMRRLAYASKS